MNHLLDYLQALQEIGVNHAALNLRFNEADIEVAIKRLADEIMSHFFYRVRSQNEKTNIINWSN